MAEVGARFALDGMPGKQLAIDSDMAAGAISHAEARERRRIEQEETTFFGSLDGASKFVKGDAVAGLLITLLNLVVGLAMGVLVHGMPVGDAFETYSILTVGDGLVTQIPAVIISIASRHAALQGRPRRLDRPGADQAARRLPDRARDRRGADGALRLHPRPAVRALHDRRCLPRRRRPGSRGETSRRRPAPRRPPPRRPPAQEVARRPPRRRRDPHGVRAEPRAGGDGRGDRPRRPHRQHAQPHRHRVRADPPGDPPDRQPGAAAGHLRDPHPGGRGGARASSRPTGCWCCCPTRTRAPRRAARWPSRSTAHRPAGSRRRCRRRRR